jgi:hypothetical protein
VQTAFARNLPFFFTREVDVPVDARVPLYQTRNMLTADPTRVVSPTIMDHDYAVEYTQTWSGGVQYELDKLTMAEVNYMGSWTVGADNATVRNVPEPGGRCNSIPKAHPAARAIRSIRFDGRSIYHAATFSAARRLSDNYSYTVSYTLSTSKDDASNPGATGIGSQRAAERAATSSATVVSGPVRASITDMCFRSKRDISGASVAAVGSCRIGRDWWMAHQPGVPRAVRRAVHRQPWRRSGKHRRRSGPASEPAPRPELSGR